MKYYLIRGNGLHYKQKRLNKILSIIILKQNTSLGERGTEVEGNKMERYLQKYNVLVVDGDFFPFSSY